VCSRFSAMPKKKQHQQQQVCADNRRGEWKNAGNEKAHTNSPTSRLNSMTTMQPTVDLGPRWIAPRASASAEDVIEIDDDTDDDAPAHTSTHSTNGSSSSSSCRASRRRRRGGHSESSCARRGASNSDSTSSAREFVDKNLLHTGDFDDDFMATQAANIRRTRRSKRTASPSSKVRHGSSNSNSSTGTSTRTSSSIHGVNVGNGGDKQQSKQTLLQPTAWPAQTFSHHPRILRAAQAPSRA